MTRKKWNNPANQPRFKIQPLFASTVSPHLLQKSQLANLKFISQVDKKFLICVVSGFIVILDQHAVDERVQLELLLADSSSQTVDIPMQLKAHELHYFKKYKENLEKWGIFVDCGTIVALPVAIAKRCTDHHEMIKNVLIDHCRYLDGAGLEAGGVDRMPEGVLDIIHSRACRSAIMFGTHLDKVESDLLLSKWVLTKVKHYYFCSINTHLSVSLSMRYFMSIYSVS